MELNKDLPWRQLVFVGNCCVDCFCGQDSDVAASVSHCGLGDTFRLPCILLVSCHLSETQDWEVSSRREALHWVEGMQQAGPARSLPTVGKVWGESESNRVETGHCREEQRLGIRRGHNHKDALQAVRKDGVTGQQGGWGSFGLWKLQGRQKPEVAKGGERGRVWMQRELVREWE